jgi:hypothetical protein
VYDAYRAEQDVRPLDIFFVHEGTYLIGTSALVTAFDGPVLYQHNLAKFRVLSDAPISAYFLLAALGSPIVQWQIRARQFSADIIDSVVGRIGEIVIPIPRDRKRHNAVSSAVKTAVEGRAEARERLSHSLMFLDEWLANGTRTAISSAFSWRPDPDEYSGRPVFLGKRNQFQAFLKENDGLRADILVPKYYDPELIERAKAFRTRCDLRSIEELMSDGVLSLDTGDEIGRLNYGTGSIPFIRTSDLGSFELKADAKHGVSAAVYTGFKDTQDVKPDDILLVRDGTYLVGSSALVFGQDAPLLYCGGINKLRSLKRDALSPYLLYALLNIPFVREQMRRKQFTRDIIDTLGHRLKEVLLPIPKDPAVRSEISEHVAELCRGRVRGRVGLDRLCKTLYAVSDVPEPVQSAA